MVMHHGVILTDVRCAQQVQRQLVYWDTEMERARFGSWIGVWVCNLCAGEKGERKCGSCLTTAQPRQRARALNFDAADGDQLSVVKMKGAWKLGSLVQYSNLQ